MAHPIYSFATSLPSKAFSTAVGIGGIAAALYPEEIKSRIHAAASAGNIRTCAAFFVASFLLYWFLLWRLKPEGESFMGGDTFNQHHSGVGNIIGKVETLNVGKPTFNMSTAAMEQVAAQLGERREILVDGVGTNASREAAWKLADFLNSRGFLATKGGGVGILFPPLDRPIELRPEALYVDVTK